jgi:8-oxo-dGTP pyrophosphatase MutT (NUDIX family)
VTDLTEVPDWLRPLVASTVGLEAVHFGWRRREVPKEARPAAVLVLFGIDGAGPDVLLLRRADDLHAHPGQVAFPGGSIDVGDAGPIGAALREAIEEVGVLPEGIRPMAVLPELYVPRSGFRVTPILAHWHEPSPVAPVDPAETAAVARVPISWLTDPANRINVTVGGRLVGPGFLVPGMLVWGFTGVLLSVLLELGGWAREWNEADVRELKTAWRAVGELVPDAPEAGREGSMG